MQKHLADNTDAIYFPFTSRKPSFLFDRTYILSEKQSQVGALGNALYIVLTQNRLQDTEGDYRGIVNEIRLLDGSHSTGGKGITYHMKSQMFQWQRLWKGVALQRYLFLLIHPFFSLTHMQEHLVFTGRIPVTFL